jgi:hypothetical protein
MNKKDEEFRNQLIKKKKEVELQISALRRKKLIEMDIAELFSDLSTLNELYNKHRKLSEKIATIEKLA